MTIIKTIFLLAMVVIGYIPTTITALDWTHTPLTEDIKAYAQHKVYLEFGEGQWQYFNQLIHNESGWNYQAANPNSSAKGLGQAMLSLHDVPDDYLTNPETQVDWAIWYVEKTYGTPKKALAMWQSRSPHWY